MSRLRASKPNIHAFAIGIPVAVVVLFATFTAGAFCPGGCQAIDPGSGPSSFAAGTLVATTSGSVPIENLAAGDEVIGYSFETRELVVNYVQKRRSYPTGAYYVLNNDLIVTAEHPVAVEDTDGSVVWKRIREIRSGEQFASYGGNSVAVASLEKYTDRDAVMVYNPQVSGTNNYFVMVDGFAIVAHNKGGGGSGAAWKPPTQPPTDDGGISSILDFSDFIVLNNPAVAPDPSQQMQGPLYIGGDGYFPAYLSYNPVSNYALVDTAGISVQGSATSIAIPTNLSSAENNRPVIGYMGLDLGLGGVSSMNIAKCLDAACTKTVTNVIEEAGAVGDTVGGFNSLVVDDDGFPIIVYTVTPASGNKDIKVVRCLNTDCSGAITPHIIATGADAYQYVDIALNASTNMPIISFKRTGAGESVNVVSCENAVCSVVAPALALHTGSSGNTRIAIGADGLPIIAYQNLAAPSSIIVARCATSNCSGSAVNNIFDLSNAGGPVSLAIGADNYPILAYRNSSTGALEVGKCTSFDCTSGAVTAVDTPPLGENMLDSDIAIGHDGFPIISYYFDRTGSGVGDLKSIKCSSHSCSDLANNVVTTLDADGRFERGRYTSIATNSSGFAVISYLWMIDTTLHAIACRNNYCFDDYSPAIGAVGVGVENAGKEYHPPHPFPLSGNIGLYGYAKGGVTGNSSVYGFSATGIAVAGSTNDSNGYGGVFYGPVEVRNTLDINNADTLEGSLTVDMSLVASNGIVATAVGSYPSMHLNNSIAGSPYSGVLGEMTSAGGQPLSFGVNGYSNSAPGISVSSANYESALRGDSISAYGVYGHSDVGPGIIGEAEATLATGQGIYGESPNRGIGGAGQFVVNGNVYVAGASVGAAISAQSGVGVAACGTDYAAQFSGNVYIAGSLRTGVTTETYIEDGQDKIIGKSVVPEVTLTAQRLRLIIEACNNDLMCEGPCCAIPLP